MKKLSREHIDHINKFFEEKLLGGKIAPEIVGDFHNCFDFQWGDCILTVGCDKSDNDEIFSISGMNFEINDESYDIPRYYYQAIEKYILDCFKPREGSQEAGKTPLKYGY